MDIKSPSGRELFTLRLMIFLGLLAMCFFLNSILSIAGQENSILYWLLVTSLVFTCLKVLHEWCHYLFITVPETPPPGKPFTVDIFTTFCAGEPYEMIVETLTAIQAITYPHKTYLCDEANDPYLMDVCRKLGINHITRTDKRNAKAGNINNALHHSSGDLCVVLDPDHVPFPNFLDPIVSHFNDPKVGFVQIVQAYKNNYEGLIAKGAAQQTYQFYGPMMMTMNRYGTVLAIGANCTFRRTALDSIGGHAAGLAEDMHTSMQLHAKGWKSIYVPAVLARGLVPSTLSAYYKQQLKWSRGVFELLVTAYPKLFKQFTWQQKLHYGVIPLHYLSGVIFLINFIIPIASLLFDVSPIHMNLPHFGLVVFPFITAIVLIRHFVQWWVMEDKERGFHVVGGFLMIGTWWIFILGFIYTILRRKVPYDPTPKDGNESNNWPLNIPNLLVIGFSLTAIVYGLYIDWSPYTLVMSGFAGVNCLFMSFTILASRQLQYYQLKKRNKWLSVLMSLIKRHRINLWLFRRRIYAGVRSTALMTTILLTCVVIYFLNLTPYSTNKILYTKHKNNISLLGIALKENTLFSSSAFNSYQKNIHPNIIAFTFDWNNGPAGGFPTKKIESIYHTGALPMINWEPYQTLLFKKEKNSKYSKEKTIFQRINNGEYDLYIRLFAKQIGYLHRPIYICFSPKIGDFPTPDSTSERYLSDDFKAAWKYINCLFLENGAYNAIWVWSPGKATQVSRYFPGKQYVDWISVSDRKRDFLNTTKVSTLESAYAPFHNNAVFTSGLPVMFTHVSRLPMDRKTANWLQQAIESAKQLYPEIKGFVVDATYSSESLSKNNIYNAVISKEQSQNLVSSKRLVRKKQQDESKSIDVPILPSLPSNFSKSYRVNRINNNTFLGVVGMNYAKAANWDKSYEAFTKPALTADVKEMKQLGINTIKHIGPSIFDHNLLSVSQQYGIKIHYSFWVPDEINFLTDKDGLEKLRKQIVSSVRDLQKNNTIAAWNIGNTVLQKLDFYYYKPELVYQQYAYLQWLKTVVHDIKVVDPTRPVTIDVNVSNDTPELLDRLHQYIPDIASYGLILDDKSTGVQRINELTVPYFYSKVDVPVYAKMNPKNVGAFITNWQDEKTLDRVTFDGIKDYWGRNKYSLFQLYQLYTGKRLADSQLTLKILKPALGTYPNAHLTYHMLVKKNRQWFFSDSVANGLQYEWKLVKLDFLGNPETMTELGRGSSMTVTMPDNPLDYRLYVFALKGKYILSVSSSTLNTPLPPTAIN